MQRIYAKKITHLTPIMFTPELKRSEHNTAQELNLPTPLLRYPLSSSGEEIYNAPRLSLSALFSFSLKLSSTAFNLTKKASHSFDFTLSSIFSFNHPRYDKLLVSITTINVQKAISFKASRLCSRVPKLNLVEFRLMNDA